MTSTNHGVGRGARPRSSWIIAIALAVALGPAAARAHDRSAATLQPEQIRMVQRALQQRGLQVDPTGAWDEPTRSALGEFQASKGLPRTGQLDAATSRALGVNPWAAMPVRGTDQAGWGHFGDPAYNCEINTTIDCGPGGGGA